MRRRCCPAGKAVPGMLLCGVLASARDPAGSQYSTGPYPLLSSASGACTRNALEFKNYRKIAQGSNITFGR